MINLPHTTMLGYRGTVKQHGPFVMNTEAEIQQAIRDYQLGRMGQIEK